MEVTLAKTAEIPSLKKDPPIPQGLHCLVFVPHIIDFKQFFISFYERPRCKAVFGRRKPSDKIEKTWATRATREAQALVFIRGGKVGENRRWSKRIPDSLHPTCSAASCSGLEKRFARRK